MAEMTANELRQLAEKATGDPLDIATYNLRYAENLPQLIIELVDKVKQQAQEIERLNKSLQFEQNYLSRVGTHGPDCYKWGPGHWECAMREIAKRDRMIEKAITTLAQSPSCVIPGEPCPKRYIDVGCAGCWLAWLEEREVHG